MEENNSRKRKIEDTSGSESKNEYLSDQKNIQSFDILSLNSIKVNEKYVLRISMENIYDVDLAGKQNLKIIEFCLDWDLKDILDILGTFSSEANPNLFIFIINVNHVGFSNVKQLRMSDDLEISRPAIDDIFDALLKFGENRPVVLHLTSRAENVTKFYYKDEDLTEFQTIDLSQKNFEESLNFPTFLSSILDGNIEDLMQKIIENFTGLENTSLVLRFLRVFELPEEYFTKLILECASYGSEDNFRAYIDVPFENNDTFSNITAQTYLTTVIGTDQSSVLFSATESNNISIVNYLTSFCFLFIQQLSFDHQVKVSTCAFIKNHLDILCKLLDFCDFPFPEDFDENKYDHEELSKLIQKRKALEIAIFSENIDQMSEFIASNNNLNIVYNTSNISSLKQAIDSRKYKSYYYLKSQGFVANESIEEILNEDEKIPAKKIRIQQFKTNINNSIPNDEQSVNILCNRSFIHNRNIPKEEEAIYRQKIRYWFTDIYKIKFCDKLLDIAATCEQLKIIFDFKSHSVESTTLSNSGSEAVTYPHLNLIVIGVKLIDDKQEQRIKGIIAHELCHIILDLVFENNRNPYYQKDKETENIFKEITKAIDKWSATKSKEPDDQCNGLISSVFLDYKEEEFQLELIVRVVQILAQYYDVEEILNHLQHKYCNLFRFFELFVFPEMEKFCIKDRESVRKMNKSFKLLPKISDRKIQFRISKDIKSTVGKKLTKVTSNIPTLFLISMQNYLQQEYGTLYDAQNIFVDPEKLKFPEILNNFENLKDKKLDLNIIVDWSRENCEEKIKFILNQSSNIIYVVSNNKKLDSLINIIAESKAEYNEIEIGYSWNDLTVESQKLLLQTKINFQDNLQHSLLDLLTKNINPNEPLTSHSTNDVKEVDFAETIDDELFNLLVEKSNISINTKSENIQDERNFKLLFQPRKFRLGWNEFTQDDFLSKVKNDKYVLLSDIAGSGKSWAMKSISKSMKEKNPTNWVTYVDLKQLITKFKSNKFETEFIKFVIKNILESKNYYEGKIFKRMYEIGKVYILFDGFDEIAPNYAVLVSNLMKLFKHNGGNQLWISTREYFEVDLVKELQIEQACRLDKFSTENGAELIAKSWMLNDLKIISNLNHITTKMNYLEMARKLILKVSVSENQSIGMPQVYKIIAEISKYDKVATINLSERNLYKDLINELYKRWASGKGEIREQANAESLQFEMNFYKFHQYLAIKSLFFEYIGVFFSGYNGSEWKDEEIIAGGIVDINNGKINFLHETFREYFVADFITKELKKDSPHQEVLNMFAEVMTTEKFGVIRMFLNDSLEKQILQNIKPKMQTHKCMKMFEDMDSFADIFNRDLDNLIEFIAQYLKTRNGGKLSRVLFNSACKVLANPSQFSKFQEFLFTHCNVEFLEKLITEKNIFLNLIMLGHKIENFVEFVTKMEAKVGRELVKEGLEQKIQKQGNIFYFFCKSSNLSLEKFKLFLQLITKFLTTEEIFNLMLNCDEYQATILRYIFKDSSIKEPLKIWGEIKKWCIAQNQENLFKKLIIGEDSEGSNILHYSLCLNIDQYKQFLEQMFEMFELKILKEMITKLNSDRSSFMHVLMKDKDNKDKIEHTLMFFELKFGAVELGEILKIKNNRNKTVFKVAVQNRKNNCKVYKTLWQLLRQACRTDKEFLEIISDTSKYSENILQVIAKNDSTNEVLEFMIEELDKFDACDETKRLFSNQTEDNPILLTILAYKEEHFEFYKKLWKVYHKNFDLSEFLKIVKYHNYENFNFLSFLSEVIRHKNKEFVEYTWNEIKSLRNQDELKIVHYLRTEHWKNYLLNSSSKNFPEVHNCVQNILKEYKIDFEIQIFPEFSEKFENCIEQKSHDQLEKLLTECEKIFESQGLLENFKYFLITSDLNGRSFVHRAISCDNVEINKVLWKRILNISDWNELKSLQIQNPFFDEILQIFTNTDRYGISILHSAIAYSTVEVFKLLIKILEALASEDEIRDILKSLQKRYTLLNEAADNNKSPELHVELWKFLEKYFNSQEIIEFYKNRHYPDPLHTAVKNNTKEIFELTWNKYKSFLDRDEQVEYLSRNFDELLKFSQNNDIDRTGEWLQMIIIQYPEIIKGFRIDDDDFVKESLMSMDENGNIFYYLCNSASSKDFSVEKYLKTLRKYLNTTKILNLMKNCNRNGENIFHVCVRAGNGSKLVIWLKGVYKFTRSNNLLNKLNELLFLTNSNNHNFLDLSVDNNSFEFHQTIWDCLKDLLTNNELLNICVRKNENNFVHFLLQNNENPQIVEHIFKIFKSKLTESDFIEILNSRGHQGTNLLQTAVMNTKNIEIFKIVWNLLLDFYKTDFPQILTAVDDIGRNIISVAACHSSGNHFDLLIDYLKSKLSIIEIKEMLFSLSTSQSPLHYAVFYSKDLTLHEALWTHFSQHFSEPEIKIIIKCVDQDGNNLLHFAVRRNTKEIVELTWNKTENYLDPNEQVEYLNANGYEGKNLYEMSLLNEEHPNVHEWVQNIIQTTKLTHSGKFWEIFSGNYFIADSDRT